MSDITDRSRNMSSSIEIGDIPLDITPRDENATYSVLNLPDIGRVLLDGAPLELVGEELSRAELSRLVFQPDEAAVGTARFSIQETNETGARSETDIDLTTMGEQSASALYFSAESSDFGTELWRLTPGDRVEMVIDAYAGDRDANPRFFAQVGDSLYYRSDSGPDFRERTGYEPWRLGPDGTAELVGEVNPGTLAGTNGAYTAFGDHVYFRGLNADTGAELYRVGADGIELVADLAPGEASSQPSSIFVYNDVLYFTADTEDEGRELWQYTQVDGVSLVGDIYAGPSGSGPYGFTIAGGTLYFGARNQEDGGQLWSIDPLGILNQATNSEDITRDAKPTAFYDFAGTLWFQAVPRDGSINKDLYKLGPTGAPELVYDISAGGLFSDIRPMQEFGGALYFGLAERVDGVSIGRELWRVWPDGRVELVADIRPDGSSNPSNFTLFGSAMYFTADDGTHGQELWRVSADGEVGMVRDLNPGSEPGASAPFLFEGNLYFAGNDGELGRELWRMLPDETMELVADINDGLLSSDPTYFAPLAVNSKVGMPNGSIEDDVLNGTDAADISNAGPGDDRLFGFGGDDMLNAGDGTDTINGGDGNDIITGGETAADRRDTIFGGAGDDMIDAGYGNDLVYGQDGDDTIAGGFGADELFGQNGNDVITGSAFSDLVFGGAGDDFVNGGFGFDRINGGSGADRFFHSGADGHASDWLQDYSADEGDVLLFGDASASASDFVVRFAHTASAAGERSGNDDVQEAFVNYRGETLWALVDGGGQTSINLQIGAEVFDLLA